MKKATLSKLELNKEVITKLDSTYLETINGGIITRTTCSIPDITNFSKNTLCTSDAK